MNSIGRRFAIIFVSLVGLAGFRLSWLFFANVPSVTHPALYCFDSQLPPLAEQQSPVRYPMELQLTEHGNFPLQHA